MSKENLRYIREIKDKAWYISDIFRRDEGKRHYTKDALLYQDILEYSSLHENFKRRELDNWLVRNNTEFVNDYKDLSTRNTSFSNRIRFKKDRIDRIFNNLLSGQMITVSGTRPSEKLEKLGVDVYSSKKLGRLIWLIIKSMNIRNEIQQAKESEDTSTAQAKTNKLTENNHGIYHLILSMLTKDEDTPYQSQMLKIFFDSLEAKGLFSDFVNYSIEICNSENRIYDSSSLLSHILDYTLNESPNRNLFIDLWYESADVLDSSDKMIFLYERKLEVEQRIRNTLSYSREYEKQWFNYRADYHKIILEGTCKKCKRSNVTILSHAEHKDLIKNSVFDRTSRREQKFNCGYCNSNDSCVISTF